MGLRGVAAFWSSCVLILLHYGSEFGSQIYLTGGYISITCTVSSVLRSISIEAKHDHNQYKTCKDPSTSRMYYLNKQCQQYIEVDLRLSCDYYLAV